MLHMGAKAKLIEGLPAIELVIGRKDGALHTYDVPLDVLDALIAALQCDRDDAHEFFRRAGILPQIVTRKPVGKKPYTRPVLRAIPPTDPRVAGIGDDPLIDSLPTPLLPPPMEKSK